jgi:exodeoxyribonuclease V alpha subunit
MKLDELGNISKSAQAELRADQGWIQSEPNTLDVHFARFIAELAVSNDPSLLLAAALASQQTRQGHVCVDLRAIAGGPSKPAPSEGDTLPYPELQVWRRSLQATSVVGDPGESCPLILDERSRLYLYRYWEYEQDLATFIRERATAVPEPTENASLEGMLARYFPPNRAGEGAIDWQQMAARAATTRKFCVITGGPGTGKTTTVVKVLALLREQPHGMRLRIALAAPTGKAAARMEEAIRNAMKRLDCPADVKAAMPAKASTVHRLLGTLPDSPYFRHHAGNPLPVDVVIVDEASMVDLALMAKLTRALPPHAALILLGDKDQLASVEAGAVLGDICGQSGEEDAVAAKDMLHEKPRSPGGNLPASAVPAHGNTALAACVVELRHSFRFPETSGIGRLSRAIRAGHGPEVLAVLRDNARPDVAWSDIPAPSELLEALRPIVLQAYAQCLRSPTVEQRFSAFEGFRVLCALRHGPFGVETVNLLVERILREERLIHPGQWYPGRPVMITHNDYNLKLFNGDVGIVLPEDYPVGASEAPAAYLPGGEELHLTAHTAAQAEAGRPFGNGSEAIPAAEPLRVFFPSAAGQSRSFPPSRLPSHETVYAMTVHKSQGSEFDMVLLLLPDRDSPVLTRELLYTAVTRARRKVVVWGRDDVLRTAVARHVQRSSGLRDALWGS